MVSGHEWADFCHRLTSRADLQFSTTSVSPSLFFFFQPRKKIPGQVKMYTRVSVLMVPFTAMVACSGFVTTPKTAAALKLSEARPVKYTASNFFQKNLPENIQQVESAEGSN